MSKKILLVLTVSLAFCLIICVSAGADISYSLKQSSSETDMTTDVTAGDIDNDGDFDYIAVSLFQQKRTYRNTGSGSFTLSASTTQTDASYGVSLADLDNDGDLDYIAANGNNQPNSVYINSGTGTFTVCMGTTETDNSSGLAVSDIDNDGDIDTIVVNNTNFPRNRIYKNTGNANFTLYQNINETDNSTGIAMGDIDNDGDIDCVISNGNMQPRRIYRNAGGGNFTLYRSTDETDNSSRVVLGDVDNDGDIDFISTSGTGSQPKSVYKNPGSGSFTLFQSTGEADYSSGGALGDLDNDGDLDLIVSNGNAQPNRVYRNSGSGNFTLLQSTAETDYTSGVVLLDMEGDGDLDYIAGNGNNRPNRAYEANGVAANLMPSPPTSFDSSYAAGVLTLTWGNGTDTENTAGGLYYQIRVSTVSGSQNVVSGRYGSPLMGTYIRPRTSPTTLGLKLAIPDRTYYWKVRTIDSGLSASGWSDEQQYPQSSEPAKIINTAMPLAILADGISTAVVYAKICDSANITVNTAMNIITFSIDPISYEFSGISHPAPSNSPKATFSSGITASSPPPYVKELCTYELSKSSYPFIYADDDSAFNVPANATYYSAFQCRFIINESPSDLQKIRVTLIGGADTSPTMCQAFLWNYTMSSWDHLGTADIYDNVPPYEVIFTTSMTGTVYNYFQSREMNILFANVQTNRNIRVNYVKLEIERKPSSSLTFQTSPVVSPTNGVATVMVKSGSSPAPAKVRAASADLAPGVLNAFTYSSGTPAIYGSVSYWGTKTGNAYVRAFKLDPPSQYPDKTTQVGTGGSFSLSDLSCMRYKVDVFMDTNSSYDYQKDAEPYGIFDGSIPVSGGMYGINMRLKDPAAVAGSGAICGYVYASTSTAHGEPILVGAFTSSSFDFSTMVSSITILGYTGGYTQPYTISNLPNGIYYVGALLDKDADGQADPDEPKGSYKCGGSGDTPCQVQVYNSGTVYISSIILQETLGARTVRGGIVLSETPDEPLSGVRVELWDTNNTTYTDDDVFYSSTTSGGTWSYEVGRGSYNYQISNIYPQSQYSQYIIRAYKTGYISNMQEYWFGFCGADSVFHVMRMYFYQVPLLSLESFKVSNDYQTITATCTSITPNMDGVNDYAYFRVEIGSIPANNFTGCMIRLCIDTNRNNSFDIFSWKDVIWDGYGNIWYGNPAKKITQDELSRLIGSSDWYRDGWIYPPSGPVTSLSTMIMWEGKDPNWNAVPYGTYNVKLDLLNTPYWDENYIVKSDSTSVTVIVESVGIGGHVSYKVGGSTYSFAGAKVESGGSYGSAQAYTDSNGDYFISGLPLYQSYYLYASAPGYESDMRSNVFLGSSTVSGIDFILTKGGKLWGTVNLPGGFVPFTDRWGNSVSEMSGYINAWDEKTGKSGFTEIHLWEGQSSLDYEIPLQPGDYKVQLYLPGYSRKRSTATVTSDGAELNFTLTINHKVEGNVYVSSPVTETAGLYVGIYAVSKDGQNYCYGGTSILFGKTTGYYTIMDVPQSTYTIRYNAPGYPEAVKYNIYVSTDITGENVTLSEGNSISGNVTLTGDLYKLTDFGDPFQIWLNAFAPALGYGSGTTVEIDKADGGVPQPFTIKGLAAGVKYYLNTWIKGYEMQNRSYSVIAPSSTVSIILNPYSGSIKGKVQNYTDYSKVRVVGTVMGEGNMSIRVSTVTAAGDFVMTELGTGEYVLRVNQYDIAPTEYDPMGMYDGNFATVNTRVSVANGRQTQGVTLALSASASLSGSVYISTTTTNWTANDLAGRYVRIVPKTMDWMGMTGAYYQAPLSWADVNRATFSVKGLAADIYIVTPPTDFNYDGMPDVAGKSAVVIVGEAQQSTTNFYLTAGYKIRGTVQRPVTGSESFSVNLANAGYSTEYIMSYWVDFSTQPSARTLPFELGPVMPGAYMVRIYSENYRETATQVKVEGSDVAMPTIFLKKGATIKGRLVDAETGHAVSSDYNGVYVSCEATPWQEGSYKDTYMSGGINAQTGDFRLPNLPSGTYIVRVRGNTGTSASLQYKSYASMFFTGINVPDSGESVDLGTIKLKPGVTISGRVTDETGTGIANIRMSAQPSSYHGERVGLEALTDSDGYYTVKAIDENIGHWDVYAARRPEWREGIVFQYAEEVKNNVVPKSTAVNFVLKKADGAIKGKVVTSDSGALSLPLPGEELPCALVLMQNKNKIYDDPMGGIQQATKFNGEFEVKALSAGSYLLKVFSKGYPTVVKDVTIVSGQTNHVFDPGSGNSPITLTKGGMAYGNITTKEGKKLNSSKVSVVVAATKDMKKMVFGSFVTNSTTREIESYKIDGLEKNVEYLIALAGSAKSDVFIAEGSVTVTDVGTPVKKNIVYTDNPPRFIVQAKRDTAASTKFYIDLWSNEPLLEKTADTVISVESGNGTLSGFFASDDRYRYGALYTSDGIEPNFRIGVSGHDLAGQHTTSFFLIYTGEKGRNEEIINPVVGGNVVIGEGDSSGFYIPAGTRLILAGTGGEISDINDLKIKIASIESTEVGAEGKMKKSLDAYSFEVPTLRAQSTPGDMHSAIYNMEIYLITGPLAQLASEQTAKVTIEYDTNVVTADKLDICYYDTESGNWIKQTENRVIDEENNTIASEVGHFTKFAAFVDEAAPDVPQGLAAKKQDNGVKLDWVSSSAYDTAAYNIYRSTVSGGPYTLIDTVPDGGGNTQSYEDATAPLDAYYVITALDDASSPNESAYSNEASSAYALDVFKSWAWPNPFDPTSDTTARITYRIPASAGNVNVDVKIYNMAGELIKDDFASEEGAKDGGSAYEANWDGTNESGRNVADGIYIYYVKMGDTKEGKFLKKIALIRSK